MPCVRKYIDIFIKEHGCSDLFDDLLQDPILKNPQDEIPSFNELPDTNIPPMESQIEISEINEFLKPIPKPS